MKKLLFLCCLFWMLFMTYISFWSNQISQNDINTKVKEWYILSDGYSNFNECNNLKNQYNTQFSDYTRSECFLNNTQYYYFICQSGNSCSINQDKTTSLENIPHKAKLDNFLIKVSALQSEINNDSKYITTLEQISTKLSILSTKYKSNHTVNSMIVYLQEWIIKLKENVSHNEIWVDDFFCELLENCWNNSSNTSTTNITNSQSTSSSPTNWSNNAQKNNTSINDIWSCSWTLPTWEWIISCGSECNDFAPRNITWIYSQWAQTACTWSCENGYVRPSLSANYCVKSSTPIYDGNDVSIEILSTQALNCSNPSAWVSINVWNAWPDIKMCLEFELNTPSRKWEKYVCDNDSKFIPASQAWVNGYSASRWLWSKSERFSNSAVTVPGNYRIHIKSSDWKIKTSNWYTVASSWAFSNPENCSYYKYPAKSVEEALWYLLNTKDVVWAQWIDFTNLKWKCPNIESEFLKLAHLMSWYWKYYQSPSIWWNGRVLWAELSQCFTKSLPTWTGPTFIWDFGNTYNGSPDNIAIFDFQSWYNWGNPWAVWGSACGQVEAHWKSQYYWGLKWESGKKFDCTNKTYWWVSANIDSTKKSVFSISQSKSTLKENSDAITLTVTGLDYDNAMGCHAVIAHPYVPSAVNPSYCNNNSWYIYLKNVSGWKYLNGVWTTSMKSDTTLYLSWIKVQSYFMNSKTWEKKSLPIIEIIK